MKLGDIIAQVNVLIDDQLPSEMIMGWINDAFAQINIETNANFPYMTLTQQDEEPAIPEKWQRALLIIFAAARAKEQDSSQFEYNDLYGQFANSLVEFKARYSIPLAYQVLLEDQELDMPDGSVYTTQSEDTLHSIALAHNTTVQAIIDLNDTIETKSSTGSVTPNWSLNPWSGNGWL